MKKLREKYEHLNENLNKLFRGPFHEMYSCMNTKDLSPEFNVRIAEKMPAFFRKLRKQSKFKTNVNSRNVLLSIVIKPL